jgi:hypothetical protein
MLLTPELDQWMNLVQAVDVVQQLRVLLVMKPWHRTVAWHGLSQLVFCFALPSLVGLDLPARVETVAAAFGKLPEVLTVMRLY